jgi:hypothetical protein
VLAERALHESLSQAGISSTYIWCGWRGIESSLFKPFAARERGSMIKRGNERGIASARQVAIRKKATRRHLSTTQYVMSFRLLQMANSYRKKKRRCLGTIQNIFKHWRYLIFPSDWYRRIIFPSYKVCYVDPLHVRRDTSRLHNDLGLAFSYGPSIFHVRTFSDSALFLPATALPELELTDDPAACEALMPGSRANVRRCCAINPANLCRAAFIKRTELWASR